MQTAFQLEIGPTFERLCDASGVAYLNHNRFVAGSDEPQCDDVNRLKIYEFDGGAPVDSLDLNAHLQPEGDNPEADLEAATRIGEVVWFVTSHGRNSDAELRPNRRRLFALDVKRNKLRPRGRAYKWLLDDLMAKNGIIREAEMKGRAPEKGGVSIEALCEGPNGALWIGFRSPLVNKEALCYAIENPLKLVDSEEEDQHAKLGEAWTLDLDGHGLRDWKKCGEDYLLLSGSAKSLNEFGLWLWSGEKTDKPVFCGDLDERLAAMGLEQFHPEAILIHPTRGTFLFGDDGDLEVDGTRNKDLPSKKRFFRSVRVVWEE